jgi:hypothetical protein
MSVYRFQKEVDIVIKQIEIYEVEANDVTEAKNILKKLESKDAVEIQAISLNRYEEEPELLIVDKNYEEC